MAADGEGEASDSSPDSSSLPPSASSASSPGASRLSLAAFALCPDEDPAVSQLRQRFIDDYGSKPAEGGGPRYDPRDLEFVRTNDALLRRVLRSRNGSLDAAAHALDDALVWRREFEINDITELSFDAALLEHGAIYLHGLDRDSNRILWLHVRMGVKSHLDKRRLVAFWVERHTQRDPNKKITVMFDMAETGLSNVDLDFIRFVINSFKIYYPGLLAKIIVFEMPWIMNAAWKIIKGWLGPEAIQILKFVSRGDVQQHIGADCLPPHMGGLDKFRYSYPPLPEDDHFECPVPSPEDEEPGDAKEAEEAWTIAPLTQAAPLTEAAPLTQADAPAHRQVSFADDVDARSLSAEPSEALAGEGRARKLKRPVSIFRGPLLNISPAEELQFGSRESGGDTKCLMVLTNATQAPVAFKVKTTAPEKYRVRPSNGNLEPGASCDVQIALLSSYEASQMDKFQVIAAEVKEEVVGAVPFDLSAFWKNVPRQSLVEHRLRCRVVAEARNGGLSRGRHRDSPGAGGAGGAGDGGGGGLGEDRDELMAQMASVMGSMQQLRLSVRELNQQTQRVLWLQKLLVLLLLLSLLLLLWLDRSPGTADSATTHDL
ncbi:motile sperm domain-containing protein 2 isoform X1 [Lethenteron reissneri]|uniref:motile sperm domain-containing protein 2 isoform X1 n=1 Tax=Lethenteron reissneri TaxID=7753 RepID=UPI002AB72BF4|nr:motile sperm domain-containing protein 2 isoform X1 [Lethenteron reissneri]